MNSQEAAKEVATIKQALREDIATHQNVVNETTRLLMAIETLENGSPLGVQAEIAKQFGKLDQAIGRYQSLMADPQPGLITWCEFLREALLEIEKEIQEQFTKGRPCQE